MYPRPMPGLSRKNIYLFLLIVSATIFFASMYKRVITYDDAFFAERAYWLNKIGYVRSELFAGAFDWGDRQYAYHKLHVWQDAVIAKYIGWSPYNFKAAPAIYLLIFCYFAYRYHKRYLSPDNSEPYLLFLSLLLVNTYIVHFGFESRPEVMMMCAGFLSFLAIRHGVRIENMFYLFLSGGLAGAATLFHLNGLMYIAAGIGLLFYMRHYRYLAVFTLSSGIVASIYWYEMIINNTIPIGLSQILHSPAVTPEAHSGSSFIVKILSSPKRYFQHLFDFSYTLLFILALYFYRKNLWADYELKLLLVYFIIAEIILSIINPGNKSMYVVLHMPFTLFIIITIYDKLTLPKARKILLYAFVFYALTHIGHIAGLVNQRNSEVIAQNAGIVKKYGIQKSDKIIAPTLFIFNEIGNARISTSQLFYFLAGAGKLEFNCKEIFNYAKQNGFKYLILEPQFLPELAQDGFDLSGNCPGYHQIGSDYGYFIFQETL